MKTTLPSDRFLNCPKFKNMTAKLRGETLQKFSSCSRCTSWLHRKDACKVPLVDCKEQIDGVVCGQDHSRLVCQSGIPYCTSLALNAGLEDSPNVSHINEDAPTIPYIQDLPVQNNDNMTEVRTY